jgi:regulator of RNase E activity RraB
MSEDAITTAVEKHYARNQHLRLAFEQRGVDLDALRPIEFHFWAWTQRDAAVVARSLYQMGFLVRLIAPAPAEDDPDRWSIEAGAKIALTQASGNELTEKLVRLAANEDAVFDGWGTSI